MSLSCHLTTEISINGYKIVFKWGKKKKNANSETKNLSFFSIPSKLNYKLQVTTSRIAAKSSKNLFCDPKWPWDYDLKETASKIPEISSNNNSEWQTTYVIYFSVYRDENKALFEIWRLNNCLLKMRRGSKSIFLFIKILISPIMISLKKLLFFTNSLAKLLSDSWLLNSYWAVCYRTVQLASHI